MTSSVNTSNYAQMNSEIGSLLSTAQHALITIYVDQAATTIVQDSNGNDISERQVSSISHTESYTDTITNVSVNGVITITFNDGSTLAAVDDVDIYWYILAGSPFPIRSF